MSLIQGKSREVPSALSDDTIKSNYYLCSTPDEMIGVFEKFGQAGMNHIIYSDFSTNAKETIESFRTTIIPYFKD